MSFDILPLLRRKHSIKELGFLPPTSPRSRTSTEQILHSTCPKPFSLDGAMHAALVECRGSGTFVGF